MFKSLDILPIIWTSIVAFSMIQGYLLFLIFPTYRQGSTQAKWLIALISLLCAILLTHELIEETIGYETLPQLIFLDSPLWYLLSPLIFFYIRLFTQNQTVRWRDLWHIIPAAWMIWSISEFYVQSSIFKLQFLEMLTQGNLPPSYRNHFIIFWIQSAYYLIVCWHLLYRTKKVETEKTHHRWLVQLIIGLGFITIIGFLSLTNLIGKSINLIYSGTIYIVWVSGILLVLFLNTVRSPKELFFIVEALKFKSPIKRFNDLKIFQEVKEFMNVNKPYHDPQYNIHLLAKELGLSKNQLNQLIKYQTDLSFRDFINKYRVKDAKEKLKSSDMRIFTIESIANGVGFTSLATFYRVFKKSEGITPKSFIQQ